MVWGFIIALVLVAGICLLITSATGKKPSAVSWIVAFAMWLALSFETNSLIKSIDGRSQMADLVSTICGSLSGYTDYIDVSGVISSQEANEIALGCKIVMPSYSRYFRASDFHGKTYGDIPAIVSANIDKAMRRSVWNSIGWIVLTLILGIVAMVVFMENNYKYDRRDKPRSEGFQRNNRYHSRNNKY